MPPAAPNCPPPGLRAAVGQGQRRPLRREGGPSLIEQRQPARGQVRNPDRLDASGPTWMAAARQSPAEIRIDHIEEVTWSEPIGRIEDVGAAPSDELFPDVDRQRRASAGRETPDRHSRPEQATVVPVEPPRPDLVVRVGPQIEAAGELNQPAGRGRSLRVTGGRRRPRRVVDRGLRKQRSGVSTKPRWENVCAVEDGRNSAGATAAVARITCGAPAR